MHNIKLKFKKIVGLSAVISVISASVTGCSFLSTEQVDSDISEFNGDYNVSAQQVYISGFDDMIPGDNDPATGRSGDPQVDILVVNNTENYDVNIQYVVTVYAKALTDIATGNGTIPANDYLDGKNFIISSEGENGLVEEVNKYYILTNKSAVMADKYSEDDGDVIAVRYYVSGSTLDAPTDDIGSYAVDSFKLGLSNDADPYYSTSAETNVTIKVQGCVGNPSEYDWITVDSVSLYSVDYSGSPIDVGLISTADDTANTETTSETSEKTAAEIETTTTVIETLSPVTTADTEKEQVTTTANETTVNSDTEMTASESVSITETTTEAVTTTETTATTTASIYPESMSIDTSGVTLAIGESHQFSCTFEPTNATETSLSWVSSNPSIASVDNNGFVTAVSEGNATITVSSVNGMELNVLVDCIAADADDVDSNEITEIYFNESSISMAVGDTHSLVISVVPSTITEIDATITTSDPNVAVVEGPSVKAVGAGTAIITVSTSNGLSSECTVSVV